MPAFVRTQKDEARWSKAKAAVEKSKGKKEGNFQDRDWGLTNYLYHKMGKSEEDIQKAEELRKSLISPPKLKMTGMAGPGNTATSVPNPAKTGQTGVRMPKPKSMPGAFDKPSLFFKSEDVKHPSIRKLSDFLSNRQARKQSI